MNFDNITIVCINVECYCKCNLKSDAEKVLICKLKLMMEAPTRVAVIVIRNVVVAMKHVNRVTVKQYCNGLLGSEGFKISGSESNPIENFKIRKNRDDYCEF